MGVGTRDLWLSVSHCSTASATCIHTRQSNAVSWDLTGIRYAFPMSPVRWSTWPHGCWPFWIHPPDDLVRTLCPLPAELFVFFFLIWSTEFLVWTNSTQSWPSASAGSPNSRRKIFEKKIPQSSEKQNLNLPHTGNYLIGIYTVSCITSNLQMI